MFWKVKLQGELLKRNEFFIFPFRHYPDRFDGFDLSPLFSGTPYYFGDKAK